MANKTFQGRIVQKHDTKANWDKATNFVPLKGEIIVYDDLKKIKIGDGVTKVGNLAFINNLPIATKDVLGGIKKGNNINITADGTISVNDASTGQKGVTYLVDSYTRTDTDKAVTPKALNSVYKMLDSYANKKYVDDQIAANDHTINKFTFTATAGQSTFTIPFDFDDSSALTVYYNGIMMKETDNYTVSGKDITLAGFTAEAGDYLTVMGIEGAAAIDFGQEAANAIAEINATKKSATTEINTIKESATTEINGIKTSAINEINTVKTDTINEINDVVAGLPQDLSSIMSTNKTNTMAANGKITMDSTYTPSANGDVATKKYVDDSKHSIVGTSTTYPIYIGSFIPALGTAPLLWIDTTSSTGTFKYRTSTTGTWKTVPVAWS